MLNKLSFLPTDSLYPACESIDDSERISYIFDLDELLTEDKLKLLDSVPLRTIASERDSCGDSSDET